MECEFNSLSDYELNAVVGGRMHNGQINELVLKNPDNGVPGSGKDSAFVTFVEFGLIAGGAIVLGGLGAILLGGGSKT